MTKSLLFIIWVCLLAFVVANPPTQQNIIKNFKVSPETVKPGQHVHLTWDRVTKKSEVLQFFIGHSSGMGHAPQKLIGKANIKDKKAEVKIPSSLTPSTPGNIWIVEVMVNEKGTLYDVETVNIHVK
ncbi:hypothetical protein INT44_007963 [Umbelopsis vinacea]|uniref:Uncharacterized protein n=1 Tax=Umbelopsis vinacea TaxID=44442 RepID=A0A8H7PNS4_9FUNG|nr:hypothetical protein INT44_007963 [Umbelopsis vinacea]